MTPQPNVVELVTNAVLEKIGDQFASRVDEVVRDVQDDAQRQLNDFIQSLPTMPVPGAGADVKSDAKSRAGRTAVQGAVATAIVAGSLAIAGVIGGGDFDFTSSGDWKAVAGAAMGAVFAAGAAYVQRIVSPPRDGQNSE